MDQGLKERLIGAAVLVALGVWLIPWVLDGHNEQTEINDNALRLPAPEEPLPMRTETIRIGADDEPAVTQPLLAAPVEPVAVPANVVDDSADLLAAVEEPPAAPAVTAPAAAPASAAPAPAATTAAASRAPTQAEPAKPAAKPAAPERTAQKGDWVVQLGSFGEEANARRLAQRVGTFGHKADVSTIKSNGRTLYRVRVGAFDSRAKAEATASALAAHGVTGQVVAAD